MFESLAENNEEQSQLHGGCLTWYRDYVKVELQQRIPSFDAICALYPRNSKYLVYTILMEHLAQAILNNADKSLHALSETVLCSLPTSLSIDKQSELTVALFIMLGWTTMLYRPKYHPAPGKLEIYPRSTPRVSPRFRRLSGMSTTDSTDIQDSKLPFPQLFAAFGEVSPDKYQPNAMELPDSTSITASNIHFSNLIWVGKIKLEWVSTVSQHLDLDERRRTLKIFMHPAYCALICLSNPESTAFLNDFIDDGNSHRSHRSSSSSVLQDPPHDDLCREVLISFGVIFAQEKRSREAVRKQRESWPAIMRGDPAFLSICRKPWNEHTLFDYLESPPIRSNYSADKDFPFLGRKLVHLENYMKLQSPNDFHTLVFDRRDQLRYWTFISALIFGISSLALSFVQTGLGIGQVAGA